MYIRLQCIPYVLLTTPLTALRSARWRKLTSKYSSYAQNQLMLESISELQRKVNSSSLLKVGRWNFLFKKCKVSLAGH
jgi:hypothetical protein